MTVNNQSYQVISHDNTWYPTTTPSTTTNTTTATAAAATATGTTTEPDKTAAAAERKLKLLNGKLGKGVVLLSEAQIDSLLEQLDIDAFDYYVEKLADFIIKNDAKVKNHYETILRWWREDSGR